MSRRRWILVVLAGALAAPLVVLAALVGPFVIDDWRLDRTVRAVALDWRDHGREQAEQRLMHEIDAQSIGSQVGDDDCRLIDEGAVRLVRCSWTGVVRVPMTELARRMSFSSEASIQASGDLD